MEVVLPLAIMGKKTPFAVVLVIVDTQLRMRDTASPCPLQRTILNRKLLKRILKHCDKDSEL